MKLIHTLKKNKIIKNSYLLGQGMRVFCKFDAIKAVKSYNWLFQQHKDFKKKKINDKFQQIEWYPCLVDNTKDTYIEPTYFFQDSWAAKQIFKLKPKHHYDIGSSVKTMGIIAQFVPITFVDIRPIELELENLFFKKGSILELPFEDNSIESLSSLCVVEHIGLGRYGDELDSFGSEKAIKELKRVLKVGGVILFSVPVDAENKVYFNAHRAFTWDYILSLFNDFEVLEEKYHYGTKMFNEYDAKKGFGTGLFMLRKNDNK